MVSLFRNVHSSNATFITCVAVDVGILAPLSSKLYDASSKDGIFITQSDHKKLFT